MKTSQVIRKARTYLWNGLHERAVNIFTCSALHQAGATDEQIRMYRKAISTPKFSVRDLKNKALSSLDPYFFHLSYPDGQLFRFLLMCMAEEYFKSIGD